MKCNVIIAFFVGLCLHLCAGQVKNLTNDRPETSKLSSVTSFSVTGSPNITPNKRGVKVSDQAGLASSKSYDPPPEFYRGPGSSQSYNTINTNKGVQDSATSGFVSKPVTFTNLIGHSGDNSQTDTLSDEYNKWQANRHGYGGNIQDRISVGHFTQTSNVHDTGNHDVGVGSSYSYGKRPFVYAPQNTHHYPTSGSHYGGYYTGSASAESIPFDVYGIKPGGHGHYAGAGGEYSYTYPVEQPHEVPAHKGPPEISPKALLAKSFLIPLASAAVLGIAAALVSNPLLLQLGTVSGLGPTVVGKRRRRAINGHATRKRYISFDKEKSNQQLAYSAHRSNRWKYE